MKSKDRSRLTILAGCLFFLFCTLVIRFYQIQVLDGEKWTKIALAQHQYVVTEPFMRGSFYSNTSIKAGHPEDEQPFVVETQKFHLMLDPDSIPELCRQEFSRELAYQFPSLQASKILQELQKKSRSRKLLSWITREDRDIVDAWWLKFAAAHKLPRNALFFLPDYQRSYPFGSMLGTVLHTVQTEKDPVTGQAIPTGGLELIYDRYLQGKPGKRLVVRSPRRSLDRGKILQEAENGADVYLTINHYLQAIVESELARGVQEAKALGGWAVMMDPMTGEILALAQTPSFDPANYAKYFNDPALLECTRTKAVTECFEPGSIFKALTMAVCLHANEVLQAQGKFPIFSPDEKVATSNGWFPGRSFPLKDGARVHKYLNMDLALQKSSNIYPAKIVQRLVDTLGDAWYRQALVDLFSLGQKTNIELPGEASGLLPTPGKLHANGKPEWSLPTPYSMSIGYNLLVNSIQIARAYCVLANGGFAVEPHLVRKIVKTNARGEKQILVDHTQKKQGKRVLNSSIAQAVVRGMKYTTKEGGTAKRADIMGYTEAGKSGTAEKVVGGQYSKTSNISSFAGLAPASNPRLVLVVSLDEPEPGFIPGVGKQQMGGVCAAPIFREIAYKSLQYLGVAPDDPYGYPIGDVRRNGEKADFAQEVRSLKALYEAWNGL